MFVDQLNAIVTRDTVLKTYWSPVCICHLSRWQWMEYSQANTLSCPPYPSLFHGQHMQFQHASRFLPKRHLLFPLGACWGPQCCAGYWCAVRRWWWSRPWVIQVPWKPGKEPGNPSNFWRSNSSEDSMNVDSDPKALVWVWHFYPWNVHQESASFCHGSPLHFWQVDGILSLTESKKVLRLDKRRHLLLDTKPVIR